MTLLLLSGTGEAQRIAQQLAERNIDTIVSFAGKSRLPAGADLPVRVGGFGGADAFRAYLAAQNITAVLDATHPFASEITARTAKICAQAHIPYCQVLRPAWQPQSGDRWTMIDREEDAARHIADGSTVFLATGRQTLDRFANLSKCTLICRQLDVPGGDFPFENGRFLVGTPPFSVPQETALFTRLGVDWLVVKNAGGAAPATKLTAARELGLRVAMINRPPRPDAPRVETVDAALAWVTAP